jgi:hypothetical protein
MAAPRSDQLEPTDLNNLIERLTLKLERKSIRVGGQHSLEQDFTYFIADKNGAGGFIVFHVTKDARTYQNEEKLPFIGEVIAKFLQRCPEEKGRLLIPMRQCRGYLKLPTYFQRAQKKHMILVEVDLKDKKITMHDSQGSFVQYQFYPDAVQKMASTLEMQYQFNGYQMQDDDVHCGYYVHQYLKCFLSARNEINAHDILRTFKMDFTQSRQEYLTIFDAVSTVIEDPAVLRRVLVVGEDDEEKPVEEPSSSTSYLYSSDEEDTESSRPELK